MGHGLSFSISYLYRLNIHLPDLLLCTRAQENYITKWTVHTYIHMIPSLEYLFDLLAGMNKVESVTAGKHQTQREKDENRTRIRTRA
jgi:hypothetical protein